MKQYETIPMMIRATVNFSLMSLAVLQGSMLLPMNGLSMMVGFGPRIWEPCWCPE